MLPSGMTHTTHALLLSLLVTGAAACGKADGASSYKPCDAKGIAELQASFDKTSPFSHDKNDKKAMEELEAETAKIKGQRYAFKGCTFAGQGGDEVTFGAPGTGTTISCVMKDGEAGVDKFRHAGMALGVDVDKLRLDVSGVIAMAGSGDFERLQLTGCQISVHK